jgi:hypothetical protein
LAFASLLCVAFVVVLFSFFLVRSFCCDPVTDPNETTQPGLFATLFITITGSPSRAIIKVRCSLAQLLYDSPYAMWKRIKYWYLQVFWLYLQGFQALGRRFQKEGTMNVHTPVANSFSLRTAKFSLESLESQEPRSQILAIRTAAQLQ